MRKKQLGIWHEFSWTEAYARVKHLALGLMQLGLAHGDKVCIIGDNDPEYFWAQLAVQSCGGIAVGIFTDSAPNEIQYVVQHSDAVIVFAKDQEQCDKMLSIRANVPAIRRVIYWEDRGLWNYRDNWLMSFESLIKEGREIDLREPTKYDEHVAQGQGDDLAIFCYTSGTTGLPKGAMLAHKNLISGAATSTRVDPRFDTDEYLSFLPPAWITGDLPQRR